MKESPPTKTATVRNSKQLGNILKRFRASTPSTQKTVAEKSGLRQASVSQIEAGAKGIRLDSLFKILAALDLEIIVQKRTKLT
jgi:HTH-type transcriptional regulator/antitoxin HipB